MFCSQELLRHGEEEADVEAGAALRIRGRGAPIKPGSTERGDHLFVVKKVTYEDDDGGDDVVEEEADADTDADEKVNEETEGSQ